MSWRVDTDLAIGNMLLVEVEKWGSVEVASCGVGLVLVKQDFTTVYGY